MRKRAPVLPVYGRNQQVLFDVTSAEAEVLIQGGAYIEIGNKRCVYALYWLGNTSDESDMVSMRIPACTRTTYREPVGDFKVHSHRRGVCLSWGTV